MIEVELPDGTIAEFPDGTDTATIEKALASQFGGGTAAPATPGPYDDVYPGAVSKTPEQIALESNGEYRPPESPADALLTKPGNALLRALAPGMQMAIPGQFKSEAVEYTRQTGAEDEKRAMIAQQLPGVTFEDSPQGTIAIHDALPGGRQLINKPGLSANDVESTLAHVAPFLLGPLRPVGAALGAMGKAAVNATVGGAVREGIQSQGRDAAGLAPVDLARSLTDVAIDAGGASVLQRALPTVIGTVRGFMDGLAGKGAKPTLEGLRKALESKGIRNVPDDTLNRVMSAMSKTDDPMQALRSVETQLEGVNSINQGQLTGETGDLSRVATLAKGGGNAGDQIAAQGARAQDELRTAFERRTAAVDPDRAGAGLGDSVLPRVRAEEEASRKAVSDAYAAVPDDASFPARYLRGVRAEGQGARYSDLASSLDRFQRERAPGAFGVLSDIRKAISDPKGSINFKRDWEGWRGQLSEISSDTMNKIDAKAARQLIGAMDDMTAEMTTSGVIGSGVKDAAKAIEAARAARRTHGAQFEGDDIIAEMVGRRWTGATGMSPEMASDALSRRVFGANEGKIAFGKESKRELELLRSRLGAESPEWQAIANDGVQRVTRMIETATPGKPLEAVQRYLTDNRTRLQAFMSAEQYDAMTRLARVKGTANAKGTAGPGMDTTTLKRLAASGLLATAGALGGSAVGGPVGGVAFGAALGGANAFGKAYASRAASKEAARLLSPTLTRRPPPPVAVNGAAPVGFLDYLRGDQQ